MKLDPPQSGYMLAYNQLKQVQHCQRSTIQLSHSYKSKFKLATRSRTIYIVNRVIYQEMMRSVPQWTSVVDGRGRDRMEARGAWQWPGQNRPTTGNDNSQCPLPSPLPYQPTNTIRHSSKPSLNPRSLPIKHPQYYPSHYPQSHPPSRSTLPEFNPSTIAYDPQLTPTLLFYPSHPQLHSLHPPTPQTQSPQPPTTVIAPNQPTTLATFK